MVIKYQKHISGPLLDVMTSKVEVPTVWWRKSGEVFRERLMDHNNKTPSKFRYILPTVFIVVFISCISVGIHYFHTCLSLQHCAVTEKITREGIRSTFWSRYSYYDVGDLIQIRYTLKNVSDQTIILEDLPGRPAYDVCYEDEVLQYVCWSTTNQEIAVEHLELTPGKEVNVEIESTCKQAALYGYNLIYHVWSPAGISTFFHKLSVNCGVPYL
jgi:hypothetical protein